MLFLKGLKGQKGSVTAEFAVMLPAVVSVLMLCVFWMFSVSYAIQAQNVAGQAARLSARGDVLPKGSSAFARFKLDTWDDGPMRCVRASVPVTFAGMHFAHTSAQSCAVRDYDR